MEIFRILDKLDNEDSEKFNELTEKVMGDKKKFAKKMSNHLTFLKREEIIEWHRKQKHGLPSSIKFTDEIKKQRKYGLFGIEYYYKKRGICKKWNKQIKNELYEKRERIKILFLVMHIASGIKSFKESKPPYKAGEIVDYDDEGNRKIMSFKRYEGFSLQDLNPDKKDEILILYNNITDFKKDFQKFIEQLKYDNIIQEIDSRFHIKDEALKELLENCNEILNKFIDWIYQFLYLSKKIPTKESKWLSLVIGKYEALKLGMSIEKNSKKTIKDLFIEYRLKNYSDLTREQYLKRLESAYPKIFSMRGIEKLMTMYDFNLENGFRIEHAAVMEDIKYHCKIINEDIRIKKLIEQGKYKWIIDNLQDIINPEFSKKYFKVNLKS